MKQFLLALTLLIATAGFAQVGVGTTTPDASAVLDVESTTKGFLPPRMSTAERDAIGSPAEGLVIYNTTVNCLQWFNGTGWFDRCSGTLSLNIGIPEEITLCQSGMYFVTSVNDLDYLPYTAPTGPATTAVVAAGGGNEPTALNVQGNITTTGVNIIIGVVTTGSGTMPAYSTTINIPASMTQDGISRDLTLSWTAQPFTATTKFITAKIAAVGGTLNVKQLDLNAGVGNDALGILMGNFFYPFNSDGNLTAYQVRAISGIPDRMIGLADNASSTTSHLMLYTPVVTENCDIWLNLNLGADYANINKAAFNPNQQATATTDFNAYGSFFQWGRKPDGHELMNWANSTTGAPVYGGTTTTPSDVPTHTDFIELQNWRVNNDDAIWANESSTNNPCPIGFRVPTETEQRAIVTAAGITNASGFANFSLKIPTSGFRSYFSGPIPASTTEFYISASTIFTNGRPFCTGAFPSLFQGSQFRGEGMSIRCIKD
jgi:hypothetical protein